MRRPSHSCHMCCASAKYKNPLCLGAAGAPPQSGRPSRDTLTSGAFYHAARPSHDGEATPCSLTRRWELVVQTLTQRRCTSRETGRRAGIRWPHASRDPSIHRVPRLRQSAGWKAYRLERVHARTAGEGIPQGKFEIRRIRKGLDRCPCFVTRDHGRVAHGPGERGNGRQAQGTGGEGCPGRRRRQRRRLREVFCFACSDGNKGVGNPAAPDCCIAAFHLR